MENTLKMYKQQLDEMIREAEADGVVLTIELVNKKPLAMGNYHMVSGVREKRKLAITESDEQKAFNQFIKQAVKHLSTLVNKRIEKHTNNPAIDMIKVQEHIEHIKQEFSK